MDDLEAPYPWDNCSTDYELADVRIVATFGDDGGAIVENPKRLFCSEGRLYSLDYREGETLHTLQYIFNFGVSNDADPMASAGAPARIVIFGTHSNGQKLEIRGNGWFGYDDKGNLEGAFDSPPIMITEDFEVDEADIDDASAEDHENMLSFVDFPMPPQFTRATTRVSGGRFGDDPI